MGRDAKIHFFPSPHTPYKRVRLARFARNTVTPRFAYFFTDFKEKKPTVLQSRSNFDSMNLEESRDGVRLKFGGIVKKKKRVSRF